MLQLILYNRVTGELEINLDSVYYVPEMGAIMRRVKPTKDDEDGRKKLLNRKELIYVFHVADWSSNNFLHALTDDERLTKAKEVAKLPVDWKCDKVVNAAINAYIEIQQKYIPSAKMLITLKRGLMSLSVYYDNLQLQNNRLTTRLTELSNATFGTDSKLNVELINETELVNGLLAQNAKTILDGISKLEKAHNDISAFEKKVRTEETKALEIIGGGKPYNREIPKRIS